MSMIFEMGTKSMADTSEAIPVAIISATATLIANLTIPIVSAGIHGVTASVAVSFHASSIQSLAGRFVREYVDLAVK